jgi:hypothetical protein
MTMTITITIITSRASFTLATSSSFTVETILGATLEVTLGATLEAMLEATLGLVAALAKELQNNAAAINIETNRFFILL